MKSWRFLCYKLHMGSDNPTRCSYKHCFFAAASAEAVCAECMPELDELVMSWQAAKHDM